MSSPAEIPFQELIKALLNLEKPLNPRFLYRFSDLESAEVASLRTVWPNVPLWRRKALMEDIEELNSNETLFDFVAFSRFALEDPDPQVRLLAIRTLWDYEQTDLIPSLLSMLEQDSDTEVRAAAAGALERFVYAGELEEIPPSMLKKIEDKLLAVIQGEEAPAVQQAALESLGYSSRDEVGALIEKAYSSQDKNWKASALLAMGRSANLSWEPQVMAMLNSPIPQLRSEAARAVGELELSEAAPILIELLDDPDENTRLASIWSLSQVGGEGVLEILERMYEEAEDEEDIEYLQIALDHLAFNQGVQFMPILVLPEDEADEEETEDEEAWYDELEELDDLMDDDEELTD